MRFLFLGDTHGDTDLGKLRRILPELKLNPRDAVIHCGDFGAPWARNDDETLAWWQALALKKIICLGNHENYGWIRRQAPVRRFGCLGRDLGGGLFAPLPGETARIGRKCFWFYPGGYSIDYPFRKVGRDLFADELLPCAQAGIIIAKRLKGPRVDYVISHDGPRGFIAKNMGFSVGPPHAGYWAMLGVPPDSRAHPALMLDRLLERQDLFGQWYFGHHHRDTQDGPLRCLWEQMVLEDTRSGKVRLLP